MAVEVLRHLQTRRAGQFSLERLPYPEVFFAKLGDPARTDAISLGRGVGRLQPTRTSSIKILPPTIMSCAQPITVRYPMTTAAIALTVLLLFSHR